MGLKKLYDWIFEYFQVVVMGPQYSRENVLKFRQKSLNKKNSMQAAPTIAGPTQFT